MTSHPQTLESDQARIDEEAENAARQYVRQLKALYVHAAVAAATLVVIVVVNAVTNATAGISGGWEIWWSIWAVMGWSLGLAVHALVVRLARPSHGASAWEQRQIDKVLAR
jgi:hypothetical protein